jgi:hypothetical protein
MKKDYVCCGIHGLPLEDKDGYHGICPSCIAFVKNGKDHITIELDRHQAIYLSVLLAGCLKPWPGIERGGFPFTVSESDEKIYDKIMGTINSKLNERDDQ